MPPFIRPDNTRRERGFTLIELLVVIIIIGILAAVAVPIYLNQQKTTRDAVIASDLKSVSVAVQDWVTQGKSWTDLQAMPGVDGVDALWVIGEGVTPNPAHLYWNDVPGLIDIKVSAGSEISIGFKTVVSGLWRETNEQGDFCLTGKNYQSKSYNYTGGGSPNYNKILYYDPKLGGITPVEKIVEQINQGNYTSCNGWGQGYKIAKGL